jgi:hypothetical protein
MTTTIKFSTTGGGSVAWKTSAGQSGGVGGSAQVQAGQTVTVTAYALAGYYFDYFAASPVSSIMDAYANPTSFVVAVGDPNFTITAYFSLQGTTPPANSGVPIIGSNYIATSLGVNPATAAPANEGFYWTADHDARILETLPISPDQILGLIILFNMRNKEGLDFLKECFKKYMDTVNSISGHLAQAGAGNILTAYGHQILIASMLEHNYMIQAGGAGGLESVLTPLVVVSQAGSIIDGIVGGKGFDVPSTLILAGVGVPEGATAEQTAELLRSVHGRGESGRAPPRQRQHIGTNTYLDGKKDQNPALDVEA